MGSDPMGSDPIGSDPIGSDPIGSDPMGSDQPDAKPRRRALPEHALDKRKIRDAAHRARRLQTDKDSVSRRITDRLQAMPDYRRSKVVMWYVDVRDEVRTRAAIRSAVESGEHVIVPYCVGQTLQLFRLREVADLAEGTFGVLEPREELRRLGDRQARFENVDLVVVPGVAFDDRGGRVGHGQGYYDRLLTGAASGPLLVGLAFQCQMFPRVPLEDHDVLMDYVVTEDRVYSGGRGVGVHADDPN